MSSTDFLERMREIGDKHGKQGGSGFITEISINFGFWAYGGQDVDRAKYWKLCENEEEATVIKAEVQSRLDADNVLDHRGLPAQADYCLRVWASGKCLGRDPKDFDDNAFYPRWQWDKKDDGSETCVSLILDSVEMNNLPLGKKFWGRYILRSNPYHVNLGESGKTKVAKDGTKRWPSFVLPIEKFNNKEDAQAAVTSSETGKDGKYDQLSDKAKAAYENYEAFKLQAEQVASWHARVLNGEEVQTKSIKPYLIDGSKIDPEIAKIYLADVWDLEVGDIDLLIAEATPF